jgi:uncharacterized membrane protein HdeD (DUF308 family)
MATAKENDRRTYRLFGVVALVIGAGLLIGGTMFSMPAVAITGGIIALVHGVTAQIILAAEGRREPVSRDV